MFSSTKHVDKWLKFNIFEIFRDSITALQLNSFGSQHDTVFKGDMISFHCINLFNLQKSTLLGFATWRAAYFLRSKVRKENVIQQEEFKPCDSRSHPSYWSVQEQGMPSPELIFQVFKVNRGLDFHEVPDHNTG